MANKVDYAPTSTLVLLSDQQGHHCSKTLGHNEISKILKQFQLSGVRQTPIPKVQVE